MNDKPDDHELRDCFRELRRQEAREAPSFARVTRNAAAPCRHPRPAILRNQVTRTALAAAIVAVVAVGVFRRREPAPDAATLAASALRSVAEIVPRTSALPRWHSPTAFLLSPLADKSNHITRP